MEYRISRSMTKGVLKYAKSFDIPPERILKGTGLDESYFENVNKSYAVELDGIINKNTREVFNDNNIGFKIGRELYSLEVIPPISIVIAKLLGNPKLIFKEIIKESRKFNNYINYEHVEIDKNKAHIITRLKDYKLANYTDCGYEAGIYSAIPTLWGLPYAIVKQTKCIKNGDEVCEYHVTWKGRPGFIKRIKLLFTSRRDAIHTLNEQYFQIEEAYHELEKSYNELDQLKEELSAKVNSQNKELYELNQQLIKFFTSMAHEINTPLSLIKAPIEEIMNEKEGELIRNNHEYFPLINNQVNRISYIVNNILIQTKIKTGNFKIEKKLIKSKNYIEELAKDASILVKKNNLEWEYNCQLSEDILIFIDPPIFYLACMNILTNAIKYNVPRGKVSLFAKLVGKSIHISFNDTGIGISNNFLQQIFHYGYQLNNFTGLGIGLALVKDIVKFHNSTISVSSKENIGSTFTFSIPVTTTVGKVEKLEKNWKTFEDWPIYKLFDKPKIIDTDKKYSILIVEDDIDVLHYLTHFFNSEYQVMPAENGKVAHNLLKQYKVDLIISDYMMPDFDGLDLYRSIREDEEFRAIPFIIITAKTDEKLKKDALQEGILDYIEKPFSISILKAKVRSFVDFHAMIEENKAIDIDSLKQSHFQKITNLNNITEQEKNIIQLTMKGFDRKEIATYLSISHHTVKRHMENIFTKLSVHNKQELVALMVP